MTFNFTKLPSSGNVTSRSRRKIKSIDAVKSCEVEITFDPPWSKDLMSEEAKLELEML